ncbi:hypothetical protein KCU74_g71, partial [Aureobasidium melanogenum]
MSTTNLMSRLGSTDSEVIVAEIREASRLKTSMEQDCRIILSWLFFSHSMSSADVITWKECLECRTAARHIDAATIPRILDLYPSIMPGIITSTTGVAPQAVPKKRRALPAVWMRAGTSKGLYIHRKDLPQSQQDWSSVITRVMGSYDADPKQLDGIGGATSTTSKVAVVSQSSRPDADVDYTFVQVTIGAPKLDMTGNCGNIASGVGPFAVDEGLVDVLPGQKQVQSRWTRKATFSKTGIANFLDYAPLAAECRWGSRSRLVP